MTLPATYAAVGEATAKVIVTEVIVGLYLGMLCKWKTAVLAWVSVFYVQYEVLIDEQGGNEKKYLGVSGRFCQIDLVRIEF